jgi:hypothetical protein
VEWGARSNIFLREQIKGIIIIMFFKFQVKVGTDSRDQGTDVTVSLILRSRLINMKFEIGLTVTWHADSQCTGPKEP